jgi:hypothetical protein
MTRDYGLVRSRFWNSPDIRSHDDDGRLLCLNLLTSTHANAIGAFLCPDGYLMDDLQWSLERVRAALAKLYAKRFCERFRDGRHIVICSYLKWNPPENPNVVKACIKQCEQIPIDDPAFEYVFKGLELSRDRFKKEQGLDWQAFAERFGERFRTPNPNPKPYPEPNPEPEPKPKPVALRARATAPTFDDFWDVYPKKVAKKGAEREFNRILRTKEATAEQLISGAAQYAAACDSKDPRFVSHPQTWLRNGRWSDQAVPADRPRVGVDAAAHGINAALFGRGHDDAD